MSDPAVSVTDVFRVYQTPDGDAPALQGVSLDVAVGEIVAIIGASGSGKSTLMRVLTGAERPDAGQVRVLGQQPALMSSRALATFRATRVGVMDQHAEHTVSPDARCRDAVSLQMELLGTPRPNALARADALLEHVGLGAYASTRVRDLSGGQRQRVAVVAALAHGPQLFLADEPTGELDATSADAVHSLIRTLVREGGATAVLVSHDAAIASVADRVVRIGEGRLATEQLAGADAPTLVVSTGGWVQLPASLRRAAGIGARVHATAGDDGVALRPDGDAVGDAPEGALPAPSNREPRTVIAQLVDVTAGYADAPPVLHGLTVDFSAGTLTAVSGRSGSGKTTLMNLLGGFLHARTGRCAVLDEELRTLGDADLARLRRDAIAIVDQDIGLVPFLSARENVELGLWLRGRPVAPAVGWLLRLGLGARLGQRVERLSAGECQRVALARALVAAPRLLLIDEPTSRLDRESADVVIGLIRDITTELGICTICATHDEHLIAVADHRLDLDAGTDMHT